MVVIKGDILEFPENNQYDLRKNYDLEKPGRMEEALEILEDWIRKQPHFTKKEFRRYYLDTCLVTCKGSMERTKHRIEKLCTLKTLLPEYFSQSNLNDFSAGLDKLAGGLLPKMGYNHNRVAFVKDVGFVFTSELIKNYYKFVTILAEYLRANDYSDGYRVVFDFLNTNLMEVIAAINLLDLKNFMTLLLDGYGMRLKGLHIIVAPTTLGKSIDMLVGIFKSFLTEKLASRIHVHKSFEEIYEYIPRDILPVECGGQENFTLKELFDKWQKVLTSQETIDFITEMFEAKVDESFKQTDKYYEQHFGLPGSFRTLHLD